MNTCRLCKDYRNTAPLFKYGVRHYAHAKCGMEKFGAEFFDKLPAHMLGQLPYFAVKDAGLLPELEKRIALAAA